MHVVSLSRRLNCANRVTLIGLPVRPPGPRFLSGQHLNRRKDKCFRRKLESRPGDPYKHLFLLRDDSLELRLQLLVGPLQEVDLLAVVLLVGDLLLGGALLDHLAGSLQVGHLLLKAGLLLLQAGDRALHVRLALLGLQGFSERKIKPVGLGKPER